MIYAQNKNKKALKQLERSIGDDKANKEILKLKLLLYNNNVNKAKLYYKKDQFCHLYCINKSNSEYGCPITPKQDKNHCDKKHIYNLEQLIQDKDHSKRDYKFAKILCLYLFSTKKYNNNAALFNYYAILLNKTNQDDDNKCQLFYSKVLDIKWKDFNGKNNKP